MSGGVKGEASSSSGGGNGYGTGTQSAMRDGIAHLNGNSSSSNGHTNGHSSSQEEQQGFRPLHEGSHLDRTEFIRITLQSLKELGFE